MKSTQNQSPGGKPASRQDCLPHILHLDSGKDMRGGQWQVLRLMEGLPAGSTLLARDNSPLYQAVQAKGLRVERLSLRTALTQARHHDLIHAHDARTHTIAMLLRRPLVVARRVAFPIRSPWKYARAQHFIAVSQFVKGVLQQGGVPPEKISVVYDGVPLLEPSHGTEIVRLEKGKAPALDTAAIVVYLTESEGLGSGALLAMSAGIPVIASNVGGLREVITHRENGILINSHAEVEPAIQELRANPDFARRIGAAARHTVMERFTIPLMVHRTMEVYRQVLSDSY